VCAGAAAARAANENAKRQHRYTMWKRYHNTVQGYSKYKIQKVQNKVAQNNISRGLYRAYDRAQTKINRVEDQVWQANHKAFIQGMKKSAYGDLLASGKSGKSIQRFGILEAGALGRYYAGNVSKLTQAREDFGAGTKFDQMKAGEASWNSFAGVAFAPTPGIAPPKAVKQSVGWALFGDIMGTASTVASGVAAFK